MVTRPISEPSAGIRMERDRGGFSLVEVVIAVVILAFGILGLAGTTTLIVRQITLADLQTERAAAQQSAIEQIRSTPFTSLGRGIDTVGVFEVTWTPLSATSQFMEMRIITTGPGLQKGVTGALPALVASVADTFDYTVIRR
jgi:prepilin-type N-terminal cleavage/methylation domain-containing protein